MRRLIAALVPLLLAACAGGPPESLPSPSLRASFPPRGLVDVIVVDAVDRLPLTGAVLIAPDGSTIPADYLHVDSSPRTAAGARLAADPWNTTLVAAGPGVAAAEIAGATIQSEVRLLTAVSTASIPLPDPVAYRRDWARYKISVTLGTPPGAETRELPAPAPPPD